MWVWTNALPINRWTDWPGDTYSYADAHGELEGCYNLSNNLYAFQKALKTIHFQMRLLYKKPCPSIGPFVGNAR